MKSFFRTISAVFLLAATSLGAQVQASSVTALRSFANQDKTRVVLDLTSKPVWTKGAQSDGKYVVRIKNAENLKKSPDTMSTSGSRSCVAGVKRVFDGKDVRYVFDSKSCGEVKPFLLSPRDGNPNWRLVVDFNHKAGSSTPAKESNTVKQDNSASQASSAKTRTEREQALFTKYSTLGKDGLRSMNAEQAKQYQAELDKLHAQFAKEDEAAKAKSQASERDTEEVKDTAAPPAPVSVPSVKRPFIIAIDAGHGGKDPGAIGKRGVREKNVTLGIAKALAGYINSDSRMRSVLTRSTDKFIELNARSEIARRNKADILISIHADSVPSSSATARGVSVWVLNSNRAQRENGKILRSGNSGKLIGGAGKVIGDAQQNPYLAATVLDMSSSNTRSEGYDLGAQILKNLSGFTHIHKNKPIYASLAVLKAPDIPSLLIETGFLSNRYEEIQLNQPNYQKQIAYHIFKGIQAYYESSPLKNIKSRQESAKRAMAAGHYKEVTVKKGEYLSKIAKDNNISVSELKRINSLKNNTVRVGQVLYVPK